MAGLIKKQILKHLSKFAKNLSSESIQLSTLRGEGELSNLELDCVAIQNLINLPTWLQINHAKCNKIQIKIPWTKLKTAPITIFLDAIELEMVTCEKPRSPNGPSPIEAAASGGDSSYGFIQKVLEGIALRINSISVNFTSAVFKAEFQLSQLLVYSTNPEGKQTDLRFTRILSKELGEVLTFKKVTWQTMRIAVDSAATHGPQKTGLTTPIRLITNQAQIRIILRRKVSDLSVLASQLRMQFDDLLWVLTDAQVKSALLCVKSIRETIERSQQQNPTSNNINMAPPTSTSATPQDGSAPPPSSNDQYFNANLIQETSLHIDLDRIDLHICDDGSHDNSEATYKKVIEGGAILVTFHGLKLDHYPYHKAGKSRKHFRGYGEILSCRDKWAEANINQFRKDFLELKKAAVAGGHITTQQNSKLLESCFIARLSDIEVGQVSSSADKERSNKSLISSQRKQLLLPDDMPLGCAIVTDYFFPDGRDYPAPHNNIYIRLTAPRVHCHWPSLLWCNQLLLSTLRSVQKMLEDLGVVVAKDPKDEDHVDIRIEALMPRIFVPSPNESSNINSPEGLDIQISQATVTNCRKGENTSRHSLLHLLQTLEKSFLSKNPNVFPHEEGQDLDFLHKCFAAHGDGEDIPVRIACASPSPQLKGSSLKQKALHDIWSVWLRQVWIDFVMKSDPHGGSSKSTRTCPFIDSLPISLWISKTNLEDNATKCDRSSQGQAEGQLESTPVHEDVHDEDELPHIISYDQGEKSKKDKKVKSSPKHQQSETIDLAGGFLPPQSSSSTSLSSEEQSFDTGIRPNRNKAMLEFYRESPVEVKTKSELETVLCGPASTYVLVDTDSHLRLMLDHYQFMFLLRLAESMQSIGEKVYNDSDAIFSDKSSSSGTLNVLTEHSDDSKQSSGVRLVLPEASLYLVLEPAPEGSTESSPDSSDSSSPTPHLDSQTTSPPVTSPSSSVTSPSPPMTSPHLLTPAPSECSSSDTISILGDDFPISPTIRLDDSSSAPSRERVSLPASPTFGRQRVNKDPVQALRRKNDDKIQNKFKNLSGHLSNSNSYENVSSRSSAIASSGYDTASFDSSSNSISFHEEDATSIASSGSSDNQFVILEFPPAPPQLPNPLQPQPTCDVTREIKGFEDPQKLRIEPSCLIDSQVTVVDGNQGDCDDGIGVMHERASQTLSEVETKPGERKVSVLRIHVHNKVELGIDACEEDASVKIIATKISIHELGNMTLDGAGALFSTTAKIHHQHHSSFPSMRMRIDSGPSASRFSPGSVKTGMMRLCVDHLKEKILASTLANIGAFLEDEVVPEVMPMKIDANDVLLTIQDDAKPVYPTSANLPPISLHVHHASVERSDDGTFHVSTETSAKSVEDVLEVLSTKSNSSDVKLENNKAEVERITSPIATVMLNTKPSDHMNSHEPFMNGVSSNADHNMGTPKKEEETAPPSDNRELEMLCLKEQIEALGRERDSLVLALQKIQDDLITSEDERLALRDQIKLMTLRR